MTVAAPLQASSQKVRAILRTAGFFAARQYVSGKLRSQSRLVNAYSWLAGFRILHGETPLKVIHQMEYPK